jgi:pimeloyl-ACP methyl ester carboxylesterase
VLVYECLGQGPPPPPNTVLGNDDDDIRLPAYYDLKTYYQDACLVERHVADFHAVVSEVFPCSTMNNKTRVDVAGFSLGGRIALAVAAAQHNSSSGSNNNNNIHIRRLHLTGVPAERDAYGRLLLQSWKESLEQHCTNSSSSSLEPFVWSSILANFSHEFLAKNEGRIPNWVKHISDNNTREGLQALCQTHGTDWDAIFMAQQLSSSSPNDHHIMLAVGSEDKLAPVDQVFRLADILRGGEAASSSGAREENNSNGASKCMVKVYPRSGHAVPLEQPTQWRRDILQFLDVHQDDDC